MPAQGTPEDRFGSPLHRWRVAGHRCSGGGSSGVRREPHLGGQEARVGLGRVPAIYPAHRVPSANGRRSQNGATRRAALSSDTRSDWIVLLEVADKWERSTIDATSLGRLLASWATLAPTTLYSENRYALQVSVSASNPALALSSAISLWKDALRRTGIPEWELVRAEIMTPEERDKELNAAEWGSDGQDAPVRICDVMGEELLRRALHDSVTGWPSRELFIDHVRTALAACASASEVQAVMVVHLDGLDSVDPSVRCLARDDVVVEMADRLSAVLRRSDTAARVGPAEFAVLIEAATGEDTDSLARRIVEAFRCPLFHEGKTVAVRASVGVATSSPGDDADQLTLSAEAAMVVAREAGGDCHRPFHHNRDSI